MQKLKGFWSDESGATMTEFIITLPVVVIIFAGLVGLGRLGHETGRVKIEAQKQMWENATAAGAGEMTPRASLGDMSEFSGIISGVATGGGGHWGESYSRVKVADMAGLADKQEPTFNPDDIVGDTVYANSLVNDTMDPTPPSNAMAGIISMAVSMSGVIPNAGAGIRYGTVEGRVENEEVAGFMGQTVELSARYKTVVKPETRTEGRAWSIAGLMAAAPHNYNKLLEWNNSDLDNESYDVPDYDPKRDDLQ
ncbi:MAG: TadE/TadG family type IV pilus assembly protein [Myxococcota bacterium]